MDFFRPPYLCEQHRRMSADLMRFGSEYEGQHKGIPWFMKRNGCPKTGFWWCGYIHLERLPDPGWTNDKTYKDSVYKWKENPYKWMDQAFHGGNTGGNGFDCAHADDYPIDKSKTATYKDKEWVERHIQECIDGLLQLSPILKQE